MAGLSIRRFAAIAASGLMFGLCAGIELPWALLSWVMLVPWLAALDRERSTAGVIASAIVMSMVFVVVVFAWFAFAVARYADVSPLLSFPLLIVAAPFLQPQFLGYAIVRRAAFSRCHGPVLPAVIAAGAWVSTEWICPRLFGDTLGHGLFPLVAIRQGADVAGVGGLTFVIVLVNEAVNFSVRQASRGGRESIRAALRGTAVAVLVVSTVATYGVIRLRQVAEGQPQAAPVTAALVQGNLPDYDTLRARAGTFGAVEAILATYEGGSQRVVDQRVASFPVQMLVWPETVYPTTFGQPKSPDGAMFDARIVRFVARTGVPLIFGSYDREGDQEFNSAVLLRPGSASEPRFEVYRKKRLFPLTERVPAWLESASLRNRLPWLGSWHPGSGARVFDLPRAGGPTLRIAPLICLDAVDPSLALGAASEGAELLVTLSNDAWFGDSRGARLHLVVSAFRSIETRLPQLRATNTGISAVITPTGEIVDQSTTGKSAILIATVIPGSRARTLLTICGDWFGPVVCLVTLALFAVVSRRKRTVVK